MSKLTPQEMYDTLVKTSKEGRFPCVDPINVTPVYKYRDRGCAIGIFMPQGEYSPKMNGDPYTGCNVVTLVCKFYKGTLPPWLPKELTVDQLLSIQRCHDNLATTYRTGPKTVEKWDHERFVQKLNALSCFSKVKKVQPC